MRAIGPALAKLGVEKDKSWSNKHLEFFNCNPNFVPVILGGVLRLEEERVSGKVVEPNDIAYFKRAVSGPLAAMGDMLFLGALKPAALTLACIFAIYHSLIGLLAILLLYNGVVVSCRLWGVYFGYSKGWELVDAFSGPAFQRLLGTIQGIGACAGGALVAVVLHRLPEGGTWVLLPGIALMILAVYLLRKEVSSSRLAILLFPLAVLLAIVL
jgi:mannose/fructose/N-acetylgalactosamine-specific phosphotransferase system component IID